MKPDNKTIMSDEEIDEAVALENQLQNENQLSDLKINVDSLSNEVNQLKEANDNLTKERDELLSKVNDLQELIKSQASQLQIRTEENNKNLVTIDALQEKLLNLIRNIK